MLFLEKEWKQNAGKNISLSVQAVKQESVLYEIKIPARWYERKRFPQKRHLLQSAFHKNLSDQEGRCNNSKKFP